MRNQLEKYGRDRGRQWGEVKSWGQRGCDKWEKFQGLTVTEVGGSSGKDGEVVNTVVLLSIY